MTFHGLSLEIADGLARLTLTEGARGNPIDERFCNAICDAAIALSENAQVRAVLIAAQGKAFSYGGDLNSFGSDFGDLPSIIKRSTTALHSAIARLQRMDAPIVAAVHGICVGGMAGFIAGADIVIAAEEAKFLAAYAGIGFSCDAGTSVMYARRMGLGRARRFLLLNETLTAADALAAGLVDEVTAVDRLAARAEEVARTLAAGPTRAFGEIRRLLLSANDTPLETQLEFEAQALARMVKTEDVRNALLAFSQKRKAVFEGR